MSITIGALTPLTLGRISRFIAAGIRTPSLQADDVVDVGEVLVVAADGAADHARRPRRG